MATVTSYMQIMESVTNCYCEYMNNKHSGIKSNKDNITDIQVDSSLQQLEIRLYPVSLCSFNNEGAFVEENKIYVQEYNSLYEELRGEKIYTDSNLDAVFVGSDYISIRINKTCNLYSYLTTGKYCIVFDESVVYAPKGKVIYHGKMENCICNYANGEVYTEEKRSIIITANDGYEFFGTDYHYMTTGRLPEQLNFINESYRLISQTEYPYDEIYASGEDVILDMDYIAQTKPEEIASFVNLYNMTNEELSSFAHSRFHVEQDTHNISDMGQFISSLYVLPFNIPDDIKSNDKQPLVLGTFTSDIKSTLLMDYKMVIDLGNITVNEKYGNVYDYLNTQCILHLPYFDLIYLNAEYVISQTIHVEYVIDFYTGATTANIYSSFIDDIVQSVKANVYVSIPFIQGQINSVVGTLAGIYNHNKNYAYMEVTRNIPYNKDTPFGKRTNDYGMIGDYIGYIKVGDVNLVTSATVDEASDIQKLLTGGVIING